MLKLFSSAVALTLSLRGCTGGQQDCEKTIIFGSQCHNNPGSDCAFTIDPPVDGSDGIICYANTCTGVPTAVPQFGCLFQCQPTTVTKFPFCSRNDGGYWVCMTTDDETTPDKYECTSVTVCSDSVDLNLVASIYVSPNCDQLTNEETTTTTTTDTPSCPSCPKPTDPNFHQNRIIGLNCGGPSGCSLHSDMTTTQLATSTPYLCDNWVENGPLSTTWENCEIVDYYGVFIPCRYDPSGLSHCSYLYEVGDTQYSCQKNDADHILRNCVEISSYERLFGCASKPSDGDSPSDNGCHSSPATTADTFDSLYFCYKDSSNNLIGCGSCSALQEPELSDPVDVKNCIALSGGKYSCESGSDTPSNSFTCYGSRTNCETFTTCIGCTTISLTGSAQLRYDCIQSGSYWTSCSQTPSLGYESKPYECSSTYSGCNAFDDLLSCTAPSPTRELYFCTVDPDGTSNPLDNCVASSTTPSGGFTAYLCSIASSIETNYRCDSTAGDYLACSGFNSPTNSYGCTSGSDSYWYCYKRPSDNVYAYCVQLFQALPMISTSCTSSTPPIDGLSDCHSSGSYSYSCYVADTTYKRYGCLKSKLYLCTSDPNGASNIETTKGCVEKPSATTPPVAGFDAYTCYTHTLASCSSLAGALVSCSTTTDPTGSASCTAGTDSYWYCYTDLADNTYGYCVQLTSNTRDSTLSNCKNMPKDGSSSCPAPGVDYDCYAGIDSKSYGCQVRVR
jgi:hypothetical protein